jgi:hypothetical protein
LVFKGVKRAQDEDGSETEFTSCCIVSSIDVDACADPAFDLLAGTDWSLTREAVDLGGRARERRALLRHGSEARPSGRE